MTEHAADTKAVTRLRFRLLGPVAVTDANGAPIDVGGAKPRLLLVQLLLSPNRTVSADALVDALWGDNPPPSARRSLQSHAAKLRAALGGDDGPLRSRPPGYVLLVDPDQIDLWRSEALVSDARRALASDPVHARDLARQARREWAGEAIADLADHDPLIAQRRRLDQLWLEVVEVELDAALEMGDAADVVDRLESLVSDRPEYEPFWARLMTAYYRCGRQQDALETFQRARTALVEGLGVDPSPLLQRLEIAILEQAEDLDDARPETCPYKGLASYQVDDADRFYGRDDLVAELLEAVRTSPLVVVVGGSGVGKSSALRAGLVRAIGEGRLDPSRSAVVITPGAAPLRNIYQVPRSTDVVIVDQFEELFTLTADEATRREFVDVLLKIVDDGTARVVIAVRADFYGSCTKVPALAPRLAQRQVVVGQLSDRDLRAVVTKPAEMVGLEVAEELVDAIVAEAADHPGALPLVSHALVETWRLRTGNRVSLDAYREAGSIATAIARTAERVYGGLQPSQRAQIERLLLRLVEPGDRSEHSRRSVTYAQLEGSSIDRQVIDVLVEARLLTAGADGIEIAHEALIDAWPRLRAWIEDDREGIRMHRHLTSAASSWDELGRDVGELYRGARLAAVLAWIAATTPDLSDLEREFIDTASAMSESELRQHVRTNRRLRLLVAASLAGVIVAAVATTLAVRQAADADQRRVQAETAQLVATVRADPTITTSAALLLAVEAHRRDSTVATQGLLLDTIATFATFDGRLESEGDLGGIVAADTPISANGGVLFMVDDNVFGEVRDATTLAVRVRGLRPVPAAVVDTGSRLIGVSGENLESYDLETGEVLGPPPGGTAPESEVALSPDGKVLAVVASSGESSSGIGNALTLFDVASGELRLIIDDDDATALAPRNVVFSPDGRYVLAVVGEDNSAVAWDVTTGATLFESPISRTAITRVAMSPAGGVIAAGREDGQVEMWNLVGEQWRNLELRRSHSDSVTWIDFDSLGERMVSTSTEGRVVVWDTTTGTPVANPMNYSGTGQKRTFFRVGSQTELVTIDATGHTWEWDLRRTQSALLTTVPGVSIDAPVSASPEAPVLVATSTGVVAYDLSGEVEQEVPLGPVGAPIHGIAVSQDGSRFAVAFGDGRLELRDAPSGDLVWAFERRAVIDDAPRVALDHTGSRVAYQNDDRSISVVAADGTVVDVITLTPERRALSALDLSDDGSALVTTSNREVMWYYLDGPGPRARRLAPRGSALDAQFLEDGRVAIVGPSGTQIMDPTASQPTDHLDIAVDAVRIAFDRTGRLIAGVDATGSIQLWDVDTLLPIGAPLQTLSSPGPIGFSSDGRHLLISGSSETSWIKVTPAEWQSVACGLVTDELSALETRRYLGASPSEPTCS